MEEVALQNTKVSVSQCKSELLCFAEFRKRRVKRAYQRNHTLKGISLKVAEQLGGEGCAEQGTEKKKL
jgi:hypothetical protein